MGGWQGYNKVESHTLLLALGETYECAWIVDLDFKRSLESEVSVSITCREVLAESPQVDEVS